MTEFLKIQTNKNKSTIQFIGDLTISHIDNVHKELNSKLERNKDLSIDLTQTKSFDMSFIQLLISIGRTIKENNKKITVTGSFDSEQNRLLTSAGIDLNIHV